MMALDDLEAGGQRPNLTLAQDLQTMIYKKLLYSLSFQTPRTNDKGDVGAF